MSSSDEIRSRLNDPDRLARWLKENGDLSLDHSDYSLMVEHFLRSPSVTSEGLAAQRNLYGRPRSTALSSAELDLFIANVRSGLSSTCPTFTTVFLQYLHNVQRCLPKEFDDVSYLCALTLLTISKKTVLACLLCAHLEKNPGAEFRFDLILNHFYATLDAAEDDQPWIHQLTSKLMDSAVPWLRKFYLERRFEGDLLNAIDQHQKEKIFQVPAIQQEPRSEEECPSLFDLNSVSSLAELHDALQRHLADHSPIETLRPSALLQFFSSSDSTSYPVDLHALFICSSLIIDESLDDLRLFRQLTDRMTNYYIHQQDLFDDDAYRLVLVFVLSHFIRNVYQRRTAGEHPWYRLYQDVPDGHPLPTFDLFADLLRLLASLTYEQRACQDEVRQVEGMIEAILSMTQIDLNQPKAHACVVWLIKCLTSSNEENRDYIKQIK